MLITPDDEGYAWTVEISGHDTQAGWSRVYPDACDRVAEALNYHCYSDAYADVFDDDDLEFLRDDD